MDKKLYEYKGVLWEYRSTATNTWVIPFCPIDKMELNYDSLEPFGSCEDCGNTYNWGAYPSTIADYLRRKLRSVAYKEAEVISIDGIQTPQLKTRVKLEDENDRYWVEARLNESKKGRQLVLYVGEKGTDQKVQIFANTDQEKLSFDHKDRKPEEIFTEITATFPSGKKMSIQAPSQSSEEKKKDSL